MNRDFVEMLSALFEAGAEFMVVGAHALAVHGTARATGDLDICVRASPENGQRVLAALRVFGAPLFDLTLEDLSHPGIVFQMGLPRNVASALARRAGWHGLSPQEIALPW